MATPLAPEAPVAGPTAAEAVPRPDDAPATLRLRAAGQVVDGLVAFAVFFAVGRRVAARYGGLTGGGFQLEGGPAFLAIGLVGLVLLAYFALGEALVGATLGKVAAGIRVRRQEGGRLSLPRAVIRNVLRLVDGLAFYLVGAVIMVTPGRQRLGDLAARAVVVRRPTPRAVQVLAVIAALALAVGSVVLGARAGRAEGPRARALARPAAAVPMTGPVGAARVSGPEAGA